jgi:hypothetical protein
MVITPQAQDRVHAEAMLPAWTRRLLTDREAIYIRVLALAHFDLLATIKSYQVKFAL